MPPGGAALLVFPLALALAAPSPPALAGSAHLAQGIRPVAGSLPGSLVPQVPLAPPLVGTVTRGREAAADGARADDVLYALDALCGDVWCESDYDFEFHDLRFEDGPDGTAHLSFALRLHSEAADEERFARSCQLDGYDQPEAMLTWTGGEPALEEGFYWAVTRCLDEAMVEVDAILARAVPPDLRRQICDRIFRQAGSEDPEGRAACEGADLRVTSLTPERIELFIASDLPGGGHLLCELTVDRATGALHPGDACLDHRPSAS